MKKVYKRIIGVKSVVILALVVLSSFAANGQNVYSGGSGNFDAITWYLSPTRTGLTFIGTPGAGQTLNIGNGHAVTIVNAVGQNLTFAGLVIHDTGASGSLTLGSANPNNNTSLTISGDITINSGGSFIVTGNGTGGLTHTMSVGGNILNNNVFNMFNNPNDKMDVTLTGGGKTLSGTGTTFTFNLLRNNTANDVNVNNSITVLSQLDFATNGLFILSSTSNITLGNSTINGTITNNNTTTRYIQLDGSTSSGSQLIKTNIGSTASWQILYPIGTVAGGYTPLDLTAASGATIANPPTAGSTLAVKTIQNPSIQGQMRRQFRLAVSGNAVATTIQTADFYYNATNDLSSGDVIGNYTTNWFLNVSNGTWQNIGVAGGGAGFFTAPGTAQTLGNGTYFYAIGSSAGFTNVWYSYQTGVWSDPDIWTLDPSGTSLNNPLNQPPSAGDQVVILNGFTVTSDVNNLTLSTTTIQGGGTLDMAATTGHTLGTVSGSGLLRIRGVALPGGTYDAFVATTGGTIEYYNTGGALPNAPLIPAVTGVPTYNKLKLTNSTGANITYTLISNLVVNSTFDITATGAGTVTWQINDNSNTQRTIILNNDLTVSANGRIRVGSGNEGTGSTQPHILTMYGNITNNGSIKFYDDSDPELIEADYGRINTGNLGVDLHRNDIQGNAVTVTFSGTASKTITCNNTTDFYRFVLNKGTGQTNVLTVNSSNTAYFRLFGPANLPTDESGGTATAISDNALSIVNGTLELTGSINIPCLQLDLSGTGYFPIPRNGALWLNGANVTVQITDNNTATFASLKDGRILMSGLLRISAGTLNDGFSKGLGSQDGGTYWQEGGTVNCWQFRPRATGTGIFSFIQTGGTMNVGFGYTTSGGKIDQYEEDYSRFDLASINSTFQMSGTAVLNVAKPTNNNNGDGGLFRIGSSLGNYNVTGGTINLYTGPETGTAYPGYINTTAPLYNVNLLEEAATTQTHQLQTNSLVVLNNLTINTGNTPSFVTNNLNVNVGGDFNIQGTTTYTPGTGITTFDGSGPQLWTNNGTITALGTVVVEKTAGTVLTLAGGTFPSIGTLTLTSGTLADAGKTVTVTTALTNNAIHTSTGGGSITVANPVATISGNNGTFGNLIINTNGTVSTNGTQTVTGNLALNGSATGVLNIGANGLTVGGTIGMTLPLAVLTRRTSAVAGMTATTYTNVAAASGGSGTGARFTVIVGNATTITSVTVTTAGSGYRPGDVFTFNGNQFGGGGSGSATYYATTHFIQTNGFHNAGGLTRPGAAGDLVFPVGSNGIFTPNTINVAATTHGNITVRPVNFEHPNVSATNVTLRYYWRVTSSGYSGITSVNHKSYTFSTITKNGVQTSYRVMRYDRSANTWGNSAIFNATGVIVIPDFNTATGWTGVASTQLDGEYTCGSGGFTSPVVYYSRASGNWDVNATWSTVSVGGTTATSNPTSCASCPVIIGDGTVGNGHTVTTVANSTCGSLTLNANATLDCSTFTGHNFGTSTGSAVVGTGTIRIGTANFPAGDFSNFLRAGGGTVEWYSTNGLTGALTANTSALLLMTPGTYNNVAASSGGTGTGARFTVVVGTATSITSITATTAGSGYVAGDVLTFNGNLFGALGAGSATRTATAANIVGSYTIPTAGPAPQSLSLATYNNLVINPGTSSTITMPASNLTIYSNLTQGDKAAFTGTTLTNGTRTIDVTGSMAITRGTFGFSSANPSVTTLSVGVATTVGVGATMTGVSGGTGNVNTLTTPGGFTNNGTIDFNNIVKVNIVFTGTNNVTFGGTGAGGTDLNLVTVDKGSSQTPTVDFSVGGTATAAISGWLTLTNGTFNWNNASAVTISTASAAYSIPPTAKLKVSAGTLSVLTANNTNADLSLSGALEVVSGTLNIGNPATNIDNDIEYASAGTPTINVSGTGILNVNGSIRRATSTISGALVYNQTGGTVTVAGKAANNTRGVFEIDHNPGSSFTLTGTSSLTVQRPTGGTGYADIFLDPATTNVSSTSTISVGLSNGATNFRLSIAPSLGNLTFVGSSSTYTSTLFSNDLIIAGTLTINGNATLATNALNVFIAGNLAGTGTYNGAANTTTFNGTGAQAANLTTSSTFLNMTVSKTAGTTVALSGTSPTITNLNILTGILDVGGLNLTVIGDIVNNSSQIGAGTVQLAGVAAVTTHNITSSGGSFTNLTLAGAASTKTVNATGNMIILGTLNFATTNRYLNIGSGLLTFGTASAVTGAGITAFVRTNGSDSDLGVTRNWPVGAVPFTYPIGTGTNYTPITFNFTVTTAGDLNVIPVNDRHPTANPSGEQILNYYWIINRGSTLVYSATGSHVYAFPTALLGGSGGTLRAGYLDIASATPGWITTGHGGTATTTGMTFTNLLNTNLPTAGNTFHYSVGTNTSVTLATLPNPIVPVYSRLSDPSVAAPGTGGDWNNTNSWTLSSTGIGAPWGSIPFGNSVVILTGARININNSGRKTFINQIDGLLVLSSTKVGHSFGILKGTGTMRAPSNTLPAGNYTAFVSSAGGTIEYVAPMTINARNTYNNLSFIGTGNAILTNTDLTLNGSVSIGATAVMNNSVNNRNITMAGGWTTTPGGSFSAGTGTVTFNGTSPVNMSGTTTFNNVVVSKTGANITFTGTGPTTVNNTLTLTSGNLVTSAANILSLPLAGTISGGSASSYISGPVRKVLAAGGPITFPLGSVSANRYRPATLANMSLSDTWTLEYVGADPSSGGYNHNTIAASSLIEKVSMFEYWLISRLGATVADLTITYNTGSYIPNVTNIGTVANLRVMRWNGTQWDFPPGGGTHTPVGTSVTGTVSVTNVTSFSPITFGSFDDDSPLPVKWGPIEAKRVNNAVMVNWVVFQEVNNDHFEIERSQDGQEFISIGSIPGKGTTNFKQEYKFVDAEASELHKYYYRIRQIDYDGAADYSKVVSVSASDESSRFWTAYPNPMEKDSKFTLEQTDRSAISGEVTATLFSAQGLLIYEGKGTLEEIETRVEEVLHGASSGVYLLQLSNDLTTENFRVVRH